MKRFVNLFILIFAFFAFASNVSADVCDNGHIARLKELAKQIDVNYEYIDHSDDIKKGTDDIFVVNSYLVSLNLLSDELYVTNDLMEYYYDSTSNGSVEFIVNSGRLDLVIRSSRCAGYKIDTVSINLPKFNTYSYKSECDKLKEYNLDVCNPWYQGSINDKIFYKEVNKYLIEEKDTLWDKIVNFFSNNYLGVGALMLVILFIILGIIVYRKRSVLE